MKSYNFFKLFFLSFIHKIILLKIWFLIVALHVKSLQHNLSNNAHLKYSLMAGLRT